MSVPAETHHEIKIASAHRGEPIADLIRRAWDTFKSKEGPRIHQPVEKAGASV